MQTTYRSKNIFSAAFAAILVLSTATLRAQDTPSPKDTPAQAVGDQTHATPAELHNEAWQILTDALADKRPDTRIGGLAALGNLPDVRASQMIADAFADPEVDVRTAAVLAAGQNHSTLLIGKLHAALDDKEPQVAFAAATTLWKLKDHSGEDILMAVADGDRRANATFVNGARHTATRDLHDPGTLAKMGALQGAAILLGPFGFGVGAIESMRKNGGSSARAQAIDQLAEMHTPVIRKELLDALTDKDAAVRAAAAKALGSYPEPEVSKALAELLIDSKAPVRYTAAASYLRTTSAATPASAPRKKS